MAVHIRGTSSLPGTIALDVGRSKRTPNAVYGVKKNSSTLTDEEFAAFSPNAKKFLAKLIRLGYVTVQFNNDVKTADQIEALATP